MKVMIWHTPSGIIDDGGKVLEGYINFNITLMSPPEHDRMNVRVQRSLHAPCNSFIFCTRLGRDSALCSTLLSSRSMQLLLSAICMVSWKVTHASYCAAGNHWRHL